MRSPLPKSVPSTRSAPAKSASSVAAMPVRLGLAGGPLIASIVLARLRRIGPVDFYLPVPASLLLRDLGVTLFLSCVGLMSGTCLGRPSKL